MLINKFDPPGCSLCTLRCEEPLSVPPYLSLTVWINQLRIIGSASECCIQSDIFFFFWLAGLSWLTETSHHFPVLPHWAFYMKTHCNYYAAWQRYLFRDKGMAWDLKRAAIQRRYGKTRWSERKEGEAWRVGGKKRKNLFGKRRVGASNGCTAVMSSDGTSAKQARDTEITITGEVQTKLFFHINKNWLIFLLLI